MAWRNSLKVFLVALVLILLSIDGGHGHSDNYMTKRERGGGGSVHFHPVDKKGRLAGRNKRKRSGQLVKPQYSFKKLLSNPVPIDTYAAMTVDLDCIVKGRPKPRIEWYKGGKLIEDKVQIESDTAAAAENGLNNEDLNRSGKRRRNVSSAYESNGVPSELMDNFEDNNNNKYMFSNKRQLLYLFNSLPTNGGNYSCHVLNTSSKEVLIRRDFVVTIQSRTVAQKPLIHSDHPGNHTVLVGSNLTLTCEVLNVDARDPPRIKWIKHDPSTIYSHRYKDEGGKPLYTVLQDCTASGICIGRGNKFGMAVVKDATTITLTDLKVSDSTYYSCVVVNFAGATLDSGYVTVLKELPPDPALVEVEEHKTETTIVAVVICVVGFVVASIAIWFFVRRAQAEKQRRKQTDNYARSVIVWTKRVMVDMDNNNSGTSTNASEHSRFLSPNVRIQSYKASSYGDAVVGEYEYPYDEAWEFDRSQLHIESFLGEGAFGRVMKGGAVGIVHEGITTTVAVKMLKEGHTDDDVIDLVKEMSVMKVIGRHDNIINLYKVCTKPNGSPLLVIVEYAKYGNLKEYLVAGRPLKCYQQVVIDEDENSYLEPRKISTSTVAMDSLEDISAEEVELVDHQSSEEVVVRLGLDDLLNISWQVAKGMDFLAASKCVHRDLAARNVLVCENNVYKIADFGMARKCDGDEYYRKLTEGKMPVKWMPPEAIFDRIYTSQSDVWSYGILLWEIMTFGENPYPHTPAYLVPDILKNGQRMLRPKDCPKNVYELMQECWRYLPEDRPNWHQIVETTHKLFLNVQPNQYITVRH